MNEVEANRELVKLGYAKFHNNEGNIRGFCKVGGNELNGTAVVLSLSEITKQTPAIFKVYDEGKLIKGENIILKD